MPFFIVRRWCFNYGGDEMNIEAGQTVLITGASGGLGNYITEAFAQRGLKLGLVAFPGTELVGMQQELEQRGLKVFSSASDLRDAAQRRMVVDHVRKELGEIDILVNNAGMEFTCPYHELSEDNICDVISVNLQAAMIMARLVLPGMVHRRRGHIINISSLAGRAHPALQEPYAATKAGLIGFTYSLRATYRRLGVSASAIIPGFIETGIYTKLKERSGCTAPFLLGTSPPQKVIRAIMSAIQKDRPEVIVNALPVRPLLALAALCPALGEWALDKTGGHEFFRKVFAATSRKTA